MKIEIFNSEWTLEDVKKDSNRIFVFGDNNARIGKGGQAIIRDLPNSIGIRTKKGPSTKPAAYYNDNEFESNSKNILEDVLNIKRLSVEGKTIVFSSGGYGTGLASLKQKAPKTFEYLCFLLKEHFNFDNKKGTKWFKIPGHDELVIGKFIDFDKDMSILKPINNSFFNTELLKKSLNTTFDLIKSENKVAFTSNINYKNGEILIFKFDNKKEYVVCRVIESYDIELTMRDYQWYSFEGYDKSFDIYGPETLVNYKYQTHFQFVCTMDDSGKMVFKNDLFTSDNTDKKKAKIVGEPIINKNKEKIMDKNENQELRESIGQVIEKLDMIIDKVDKIQSVKKKSIFRKKTLEELLLDKDIKGDIKRIDSNFGDNYEVENDDFIYYLKFEKGLFRNRLHILIKKQKLS